jgi:3-hydroxyisobutyrate dehydrogenase
MLAGDFAPGFFVEHFVKDMGIALDGRRAWASRCRVSPSRAPLHWRSARDTGTRALMLALASLSGVDWERRGR